MVQRNTYSRHGLLHAEKKTKTLNLICWVWELRGAAGLIGPGRCICVVWQLNVNIYIWLVLWDYGSSHTMGFMFRPMSTQQSLLHDHMSTQYSCVGPHPVNRVDRKVGYSEIKLKQMWNRAVGVAVESAAAERRTCLSSAHHPLSVLPWCPH